MTFEIYPSASELAHAAAAHAADALRDLLAKQGSVRLIAATGAAQFEFLDLLTAAPGIAWDRVELFHLDEYLGMDADHPASFRRFLRERLIEKTGIRKTHLLDGTAAPAETIAATTRALRAAPIDLAFIGIGENGHLAFNDPPADFNTSEAFLVVGLDEACRKQQFGEGWFPTFDAVPTRAITMTVPEILKSARILAIVPEQRKAKAVAECFNADISPAHPASILRTHPNATVYLDRESASLLTPEVAAAYKE